MIDTPNRNGRSETDILSRSGIALQMGETVYFVRPLTMNAADEWEKSIRTVIGAMFGRLSEATGGVDGILDLYHLSIDAQLDALYAYDALGSDEDKAPGLPSRTGLRMTASRDDVDVALRKLVRHEFPLLKGMDYVSTWVPAEVREIVVRNLIRLLPEPAASAPVPSSSSSSTNIQPSATRRRSARR